MGKGWIGAAAVLALGALALSGCNRGRDHGGDQTSVETQVAPPMANVVAPAAPKPVVTPKPTNTITTSAATPNAPDAQMVEDAAAVGMTSRTTPGGYTSSTSSSSSSTSTTTTHSTTTTPATPPATPQP